MLGTLRLCEYPPDNSPLLVVLTLALDLTPAAPYPFRLLLFECSPNLPDLALAVRNLQRSLWFFIDFKIYRLEQIIQFVGVPEHLRLS